MERGSNNNNSLIDQNKVVPEHENQDYESVPRDHTDWRQSEEHKHGALPNNIEKKNFKVLPERHNLSGEHYTQPDKASQRKRLIIPLVILLIILLSILAIWLVLGDTIMNLIQ